jgi:hypothetical protein
MARKNPRHFLVQNLLKNVFFYSFNVQSKWRAACGTSKRLQGAV